MVNVNEEIPILNDKPLFSYGANGELWVSLIEKAWAILNGGYENI